MHSQGQSRTKILVKNPWTKRFQLNVVQSINACSPHHHHTHKSQVRLNSNFDSQLESMESEGMESMENEGIFCLRYLKQKEIASMNASSDEKWPRDAWYWNNWTIFIRKPSSVQFLIRMHGENTPWCAQPESNTETWPVLFTASSSAEREQDPSTLAVPPCRSTKTELTPSIRTKNRWAMVRHVQVWSWH